MDPITMSAIISSAAGLAGGIFSARSSANASDRSVTRQLRWEKERASAAHQWEIEDLKAAGLNPILSAGGNGATTGGISAPVPDTSGYAQAGTSIADAINSAIAAKQRQQEIKNQTQLTGAEINQKNFQNQLLEMQSLTEAYRQGLISKQTASTAMETNLKDAQLRAIEQDIQQKAQRFESELDEIKARAEAERQEGRKKAAEATMQEYQTKYKRFVFWKNQTMDIIGALGQAKRDFFGTKTKSETYNVSENFDAKGHSKGRKESHTISNMNKLTLGLSAARLIGAML